MRKYSLSMGVIFVGTLAACTPVVYTEAIVDSPPPVVYRSSPPVYVVPAYTPVYRPYVGRYYAPYSSYRSYHHSDWYRPEFGRSYRYYR